MLRGNVDLEKLARDMAARDKQRSEADVQSALHAFLLAAPLMLEDEHLHNMDVMLEKHAGARKRIDVEAGLCVFEVKRDLRKGNVREEAAVQLADDVIARTAATHQRYVGVLSDGAEWHLYHLRENRLHAVSLFEMEPSRPDVGGLCAWLESVLATGTQIAPTPAEIMLRFGAQSPGHQLDRAELFALYKQYGHVSSVKLKRELWARLLTTAFGTGFVDSDELFVEHTLLVAVAEVVAHTALGLDPCGPNVSARSIVSGQLFAASQVYGVVEADFFDWIVEVPEGERFVKGLARRLSRFVWRDVEHDVLKVLYENMIGAAQRKQLGEHYTPDWLAESMVYESISKPLAQRVLDPACGSGTFLFHAVRHYLKAAEAMGQDSTKMLSGVVEQVIGMDIHPVAVTLARVTYLLAIGTQRLQVEDRPSLSIPVYLGDSIQWGQERALFGSNDVRNLARPIWLTRPENAVDVLIGNPPWLSYRFMTPAMQAEFRERSRDRGLWMGAAVATNQDLSTFFVLRSMERYLRKDGHFAFVLPWSVLRGRQHAGFRGGHYPVLQVEDFSVSFDQAWDLHGIKPALFPVPSCVVFGRRSDKAQSLGQSVIEAWSGKLPRVNMAWEQARSSIQRTAASIQEAVDASKLSGSPYETRFAQGATMVPRCLVIVESAPAGPLGSGMGRVFVRSRRSQQEKRPWKDVESIEGHVEMQFIRPIHFGETILPYRVCKPLKALVPWDGKRLLHGQDEQLADYPDLESWWRKAEAIWSKHRSSGRLSLVERIDYQRGLSAQFPIAPLRVVYTKSGMYLAAAIVKEKNAVVDHSLYWGAVRDMREARYLEAILNSDVVTKRVRPLQAQGQFGPRHYDKYIWHLPIPYFDEGDARHQQLSVLAEAAEKVAEKVVLPEGKRFEIGRALVREAILSSDVGKEIEREVRALLDA